ncbi:uncharacterized protein [Halyomorpha halys]|uniref:uncharacterized protein n=1 Tax=Halyomorpha halys TaxID=286706 RepID=UPI000D0C79CE|nr:uncharacterized protein LOC112210461 [Halyomorpha halys]
MKIIGSTIVITILLLMSLEIKLTPFMNKVQLEEHDVSTTPVERVVIYIMRDYSSNDIIVKNLIYGSRLKTIFSGSYEHPLLFGSPPDYIFSQVNFSVYIGTNPGSIPTNISFPISERFNLHKLRTILQYFNKYMFKKEIYVIDIPNMFEDEFTVDQNSLLVNETFRIFPESSTAIIKLNENLRKANQPTLRMSMWGSSVVNVVESRNWESENMAVLLSGLLGVPIPGNSVGRTSEDLLNISKSLLARLRSENSLHLATACMATATNHCSFSPFKYINQPFLTRCDFRKYMEEIRYNLRNENYELVRLMAKHLEDRSLKCILQYKNLCITFTVIFATTITFLWIYILIISFIVLGEMTEYYNKTMMIFTVALHVVFYLLIVACAYLVFELNWPYRYILYLALIVILSWVALIQSSYIFNFVPMHLKSYISWLLMFYFAVIEIVFWAWEKELMLFVLLVPYVTAEWVYKHHYPAREHLWVAILLNVSLLVLCYLNYVQLCFSSLGPQILELISTSCWILVGFPVVYKYRDNPFVTTPAIITQAFLVYLMVIIIFQPIGVSHYIKAASWWLLTAPVVVSCLTDRNSISVLLIGYSSSVPVLLLSTGFESLALLILFVHMYSWYRMESIPQSDSLRKVVRGVSLYLYMFLCHLFTKSGVDMSRFLTNSSEHWLLVQMLKVYKELLPSILLCFLWAVLHKVQKQSFTRTVNYVLLLCVSVSFRHFTSVVIDDKMENLLNNYLFHLNCLLSLFITKALFKDYKVPFGYFIPLRKNKKLLVVTKFIRDKIQKKNENYNCLQVDNEVQKLRARSNLKCDFWNSYANDDGVKESLDQIRGTCKWPEH